VLVITAKSTVHSVLFLVADFLCVAALYVTLRAPFLAVIQVMVYAGGIVVLYLFVVMLVNLKRRPKRTATRGGSAPRVVMAVACWPSWPRSSCGWAKPARWRGAEPAERRADRPGALHRLPDSFELASFLLLVAMIGAIILASGSCRR